MLSGRKDQTTGDHIAKICGLSQEGIIEISGSEDFVSKQFSQYDKLLDVRRKLVKLDKQQEIA